MLAFATLCCPTCTHSLARSPACSLLDNAQLECGVALRRGCFEAAAATTTIIMAIEQDNNLRNLRLDLRKVQHCGRLRAAAACQKAPAWHDCRCARGQAAESRRQLRRRLAEILAANGERARRKQRRRESGLARASSASQSGSRLELSARVPPWLRLQRVERTAQLGLVMRKKTRRNELRQASERALVHSFVRSPQNADRTTAAHSQCLSHSPPMLCHIGRLFPLCNWRGKVAARDCDR